MTVNDDGTTDIECPRCFGTGKAADIEGKNCQVCQGTGKWIDWSVRQQGKRSDDG